MAVEYRQATPGEAEVVATLAFALTEEICERTNAKYFRIDLAGTIQRCDELMSQGLYAAILGWSQDLPVGVATLTETYALYAGGKVGIIQEFYVVPELRSSSVGASLLGAVREYGETRNWSCIELCTPPLPEFERTIRFYMANGLNPVGGRKMRQMLERVDA